MKALASGISFRLVAILFLVVGMCLLLPQKAAADPIFQIIGLGGQNSQAYGINNFGAVVGVFGATNDPYEQILPFLWEDGTFTQLPTQYDPLGRRRGAAFAISDSGYIAGLEGNPSSRYHGAIWQNGQFSQWLIGGDFSKLDDINNSGEAVGASFTLGHVISYGIPQGQVYADASLGINDAGQIVGFSMLDPSSAPQAILYANGTLTTLFPNSGNVPSAAIAINNRGSIAGMYDGNAFLLDGGRYINLGFSIPDQTTITGGTAPYLTCTNPSGGSNCYPTLAGLDTFAGNPLAMNDWGEVVGGQYIWYGGQLYNVNDLLPANSGWTITDVSDVNDWGQIVGTGIYDGQTEAFIANPVPEPGSITLLLAGLTMTLMLMRKRIWA
jgi:uncharacterized membrane protein